MRVRKPRIMAAMINLIQSSDMNEYDTRSVTLFVVFAYVLEQQMHLLCC